MDQYCERVDWRRTKAVKKKVREGIWNGLDCPWWYTERANIGMLAAAATTRGITVLEEFNDQKIWGRGQYSGRVDFMLWRGRRKKPAAFEAKQAWAEIVEDNSREGWSWTKRTEGSIIRAWASASRSARQVHHDYHRHAVLFLPVYSQHAGLSGAKLQGALSWAMRNVSGRRINPSFTAFYTTPRVAKLKKPLHPAWSQKGRPSQVRHHVGVILAICRI